MKCVICGINELTTGDGYICLSCRNKKEENLIPIPGFPYSQGWVCPKCGSVYAPHMTECVRCNPTRKLEVTCLNEVDGQC